SSAPISPGFVHRSASRTIRRLYSAANRRRSALATTSTSGAAPAGGAPAGKTPVALRAPSASPASMISPLAFFSTTFIHLCLPALYSLNYDHPTVSPSLAERGRPTPQAAPRFRGWGA